MSFLSLVPMLASGRLSAAAQSATDQMTDPARARALAAEGLSGPVWDELLGLLRYAAFSGEVSPPVTAFLEWLRSIETVLHGPAATPERFLAGVAILTELIGRREMDDAPRALAQWILAAGYGVRRDQGSWEAPAPHVTWASLDPGVCASVVDQLLLAVIRTASASHVVVSAMVTNLPLTTPGLRDLWDTWLAHGDSWQEALDDAAVPQGWRRLAERFPSQVELGLLARPDWRERDLERVFLNLGDSAWADLIPQDVPQVGRLSAMVRRSLAGEKVAPSDWPVWDHLADRRRQIWPVFHPLLVEILTALTPVLRQWGVTGPARLQRWLEVPGLIEQLERPTLLQLIQHGDSEVRRQVVTTLALRETREERVLADGAQLESPSEATKRAQGVRRLEPSGNVAATEL